MAYSDNEVSVRGGKPNELYKFAGTYSTYCYTSGPVDVMYDDGTVGPNGPVGPERYKAIAIQRSAINAGTQDDDKLDMQITIAVTHQIVLDYAFQDTPPSLQLSVYRYHNLDDVIPYWYGPVNNIQVTNGRATIRSYSKLGAALSQQFPNVYYQAPCNHVLYDARCGVSYMANSDSRAVSAVAGRTITFSTPLPATFDGKLKGGEVQLESGERRMITAQTASSVTVNFPFGVQALEVGDNVRVAKGCDLAFTGDCANSFNNQLNFGGFPFIPLANPFTDGIDGGTALPDNTCKPIPVETPWKYMSGDNLAWADPNYDDSGWPYGITPFGNNYTGPGGNGATTYIPGKDQGQPICWFRTWIAPYVNQFIITKDDSARVWCDGVEFTGGGIGDTLVTPPAAVNNQPRLIAVRVDDDKGGGIVFSDALLGHGN